MVVSTETLTTLGAALLVAVGIAGLIVPVLPGLACVVLGVLVWAIGQSSTAAWVVFAVACVLAVAGYVVQVLVPGRQLSRGGVARRSNIVGLVCAVVGVFVVPVIGLLLGFVIGVFLAESARLRDRTQAWAATRVAIRAALTSVGIELAAAVTIAVGWAIAAFVLAR
ncbi:membrane protein [Dermacoccus nishinomiyaensis]|uniref:Membrane protein n=1 Tax=Dermacoccus nishinomiyaensis TaxID=1274 RepID=A0A075JFG9_9MICO|nr:DUF456 domain-containing protein [Dermacoccus nishinomiyaensis]AIF40604.1 membrane protein [Dermacoccus nishinomiyaensis]